MQDDRRIQNIDLWVLLSRTYQMISRARSIELAKYGITREQDYILFIIYALGNIATPTEISKHTYRQQNSVTEILNRMTANGLVVKTKDLVRKGHVNVKLTEKGLEIYHKTLNRESINNIMSVLSEEYRQNLTSCLELLSDRAVDEISFNREKLVPPSQLMRNMTSANIIVDRE